MDLLRACYNTQMRFYAGDDRTTNVSWYFVPRGRAILPFANVYVSSIWENPDGFLGLPGFLDAPGEVLGDLHPFRRGGQVGGALGNKWCGEPEQWGRALTPADGYGTLAAGGDITCCVPALADAVDIHRGLKEVVGDP